MGNSFFFLESSFFFSIFFFTKNLQVKCYYETFYKEFLQNIYILPSTICFKIIYVDLIPYAAHQLMWDDNLVTCIKKTSQGIKMET